MIWGHHECEKPLVSLPNGHKLRSIFPLGPVRAFAGADYPSLPELLKKIHGKGGIIFPFPQLLRRGTK
jgi:hypothetical protein